jgi:hypothetical protein
MINQAYYTASTMQTMLSHLKVYNIDVNYSKMKEANVLILMQTGVYILANIKHQNRNVEVYLSDRDEIVTTDVVQLFNVCQNSVCWVELS